MQTRKVVGVGVAVVALALAVASWRPAPAPAPSAPPDREPAATPPPPATAHETPGPFRPLLGEWERPDGGYVLVVEGIRADGRATVTYLNPRPIRVARAEARHEGDLVGLFVEFDDVNYQGSTYTLGFDERDDQLRGIYYQAPMRQRFEVVFVRRR
ncbi:MAG TPA: hypothetical protein VGB87_09260 [Vicinamibacteria bacterium]